MNILDRIFKDKNGKIVLGQFPNIPLITYIFAWLLSKVTQGLIQQSFEALAFGALFVFAWLELFEGVNYFRRALGLVIILLIIVSFG